MGSMEAETPTQERTWIEHSDTCIYIYIYVYDMYVYIHSYSTYVLLGLWDLHFAYQIMAVRAVMEPMERTCRTLMLQLGRLWQPSRLQL